MSDAMTNREIEDVLTSIRRLVAQDGARPAETPARDAGRLILTEAHRVDAPPAPASGEGAALPAPDFGRLEATIAELEAAVSASGETWEPEAPAEAPRASNVTELYGRFTAMPRRAAGEGAPVEAPAEPAVVPEPPAEAASASPAPEGAATPDKDAAAEPGAEAGAGESVLIDEAALYALVAQIVREELQGQLGERITAQVRKLVRAEIAKALDERKFL